MVASRDRSAHKLPDAEVEERVRESFRRYRPLAMYGTGSIRIAAKAGVVTLSGNVPDEPFRRMAVSCARATLGALEIRDQLTSDVSLVDAVAEELRRYPELQPSRVRITANLGLVTLAGEVEAAELVRLAETVAGKVPGVVAVDNRLRVRVEDHRARAVDDPLVLVVVGPPGGGKSTIARHISEQLGVSWLSAGALLRDAARTDREIAHLIAIGELVPDAVVDDVVARRLLDVGPGCVLDGYPRTVPQALRLLALLWERSWRVRRVFRVRLPEQVALQRVLARGRVDDRPEVVAERLRLYHRRTEPAIGILGASGAELGEVDNSRPREEVERLLEPTLRRLAAAVPKP